MPKCDLCKAKTKDGKPCKNRTCKNFPYCWVHLKSKDKLQVKKSTIKGAGQGLFYVGKKSFPTCKFHQNDPGKILRKTALRFCTHSKLYGPNPPFWVERRPSWAQSCLTTEAS